MERDTDLIKYQQFETPCFIVDNILLEKNLRILKRVKDKTGVKILLALKGYAMFSSSEIIGKYLDGTCASSPYEAHLGRDDFHGEVHTFAAAYSEKSFKEIITYSDHIIFNSIEQYNTFYKETLNTKIKFGLRINPEHSETECEIYNPAAPKSRLGITKKNFPPNLPAGITGLHIHTLCQQDSYALERTFQAVEKTFAEYLHHIEWINLGGGHHITRQDYNIDHLVELLNRIKDKYNITIYLEPGEAVALNAGFLTASVLDIVHNEIDIVILDTSAAAHMPDVIEMPYRPYIINSDLPGKKKYTYRITGYSCLAGDIMGDYSFDYQLKIGDKITFTDMAIYSMVKTNTFNGIPLPDIIYYDSSSNTVLHKKSFSYHDFRNRLS